MLRSSPRRSRAWMPVRAWAIAVGASCLLGCSPTCLLQTKFLAPAGLPLTPERFFVTGTKACPPAEITAPAAGDTRGDAEYVRARPDSDGIDITAAFRGRQCRVQVTGWYDANGNGAVDGGDWVGSSQAMDVADEGLFGDNSVRSPDVLLVPRS